MKAGTLPKGWRQERLSDVCVLNPRRPQISLSDGEPVSFVQMSSVSESGKGITRLESKPFREVKSGYTYFSEGDVLFAKITPCMQNAKHAIAKGLHRDFGFGSTEFHVVQPAVGVLAEWIHFFLIQPKVLSEAVAHFSGAVGQQRVPSAYLANLEIPLPPLPEQKRIAAVLNEQMALVERARAAAREQLEAAKKLPAALLREVFEGEEARGWEVRRLGDVSDRITDGTHQPPPFTSSGIPFLFVRNIVSGKLDFDVEKYVSQETYESLVRRCKPEQGDILYSAVGSFGVAVVIDTEKPFTFQRHIAHIKPNPTVVSPHFMSQYLNSPAGRRQSELSAFGGAQRTVTLSSLYNFRVPVPPLKIQNLVSVRICEQMTIAKAAVSPAAARGDMLASLPAALLRRAFSGEL
jgi:type I restriction enzyme S subunit